jgi:hypothetical protein
MYHCADYRRHPRENGASSSPLVIMVKSIQNRNAPQKAVTWGSENAEGIGDLSIDALMRAHVVEVKHVLFGQTPGIAFAQNKEVIEEFTPHTVHEMLANGVRFGCIGWRVDERAPGFIHLYGSNINLQGEIRTDGQFSQYNPGSGAECQLLRGAVDPVSP